MHLSNNSIILRICRLIRGFIRKLNDDHISAFSAQSSYFLILTIFPFIMLLLTIIQYTPITESFLLEIIQSFVPENFKDIVKDVIGEIYNRSGTAIISITAIASIWSSSKGILALIKGLNYIYKVDQYKNYFLLRLKASIYTLAFIVGIIVSLTILVFGNSLLKLIANHQPLLYNFVEFVISLRGLYIPIFLTLIFVFLYKMVPNKNFRFWDHIPGALFSALGWEIFSYAYSVYIDYYANYSYIYGSLTTIVLLLLWVYICMYILFIGAEINVYFRRHFQMATQLVKQYREDRIEDKDDEVKSNED